MSVPQGAHDSGSSSPSLRSPSHICLSPMRVRGGEGWVGVGGDKREEARLVHGFLQKVNAKPCQQKSPPYHNMNFLPWHPTTHTAPLISTCTCTASVMGSNPTRGNLKNDLLYMHTYMCRSVAIPLLYCCWVALPLYEWHHVHVYMYNVHDIQHMYKDINMGCQKLVKWNCSIMSTVAFWQYTCTPHMYIHILTWW